MAAELKIVLGKVIKSTRFALGISQEELAVRAGLHRTYVSDVERGARNPSLESVAKLADALELSLPMLLEKAGLARTGRVDILLVENNPRDVELTKLAFEKARILNLLHVVGDGVEALDFLFATGAYQHRNYAPPPQVILLDLNLPRKSGLEVLRRIKADQILKDISVIVLTESREDRDITECRQLGVEAYIVKPVGFKKFSEVTRDLNLAWTLVNAPRTEREPRIPASHEG
jgi:CheY-like chemotaxis protein/DNA-binding XRE family transcriptional regulator